jgi:hypothetical protein
VDGGREITEKNKKEKKTMPRMTNVMYRETGLEEINGDLLDEDLWPAWSGAEKITKTERQSIGPTDRSFFGKLSRRL